MLYSSLSALAVFAFVTSVTPGPNNLMLLASGANFGFRRSVPHMLGIGIGFTVMIATVGLGLMGAMERFPRVEQALKVACLIYLCWLAYKIGTAGAPDQAGREPRPLTFLQAAAFQWVNPKAWAMAVTAISLYAPDRTIASIALVSLIFGAINLPSVSVWTALGQALGRLLTVARHRRVFNMVMAGLLILSVVPLL